MDNKAAGDYLDRMYGDANGYVAVAFKGPRNSWTEQQFEWPTDRRKILWWAKQHEHGDVFVCPALRADAHTRKKGDGTELRWLWADVDMDKVPAERRTLVAKRIEQLGTYVVSSGSGDNAHVYVRLAGVVNVDEHYRLNTGLRDYLYADAKHADNSLLRLPGTTNHKPGANRVSVRSGHGKSFRPDTLRRLRAFARVTGTVDGGMVEWTRVDTTDVPPRLKRLSRMATDEAVGRYGSRYKAEWAVTGELHRAGLDANTIHTLMDRFPAAVDKADEEHGAHDVHKTVAKRLRAIEEVEKAVDAGDESAFQELSDEDKESFRTTENPRVKKLLEQWQAHRLARQIEAQQRFIPPPDAVSWCASDGLSRPPEPKQWLIGPNSEGEGIAGVKHNVVITAQYKTGKTALVVASLAKALCDGTPFLGEYEVPMMTVGHWNMEMEGDELKEDYIRPAGFDNPDNLHVANLRGYGVNILTEIGKAWTVKWLRDRQVQVWTIDSLARLLRMCGVKEKENDEVLNVLMAIDEIKVEAGVEACFVITHTGRSEEASERARGATVIDDWPDSRWIITRQDEIRFMMVEGRGVGMPSMSLNFDHTTKTSTLGLRGKGEVAADAAVQTVVQVVRANSGILRTPLIRMVCQATGKGREWVCQAVDESVETGWVELRRESSSRGGRAKMKYYPVLFEDANGGAKRRVIDGVKAARGPAR